MTEDNTVEPFPQDQVTPTPKPMTIFDAMGDATDPAEMMARVRHHFPGIADAEISAQMEADLKRQSKIVEREKARLASIDRIGEAFQKSGLPKDAPMIEHAKVLAERGDPLGIELMRHFDSPTNRIGCILVDKAVELDPYWTKDGKYYHGDERSMFESPDDLMWHYVKIRGDAIADDLPDDLKPHVDEFLKKHCEKPE